MVKAVYRQKKGDLTLDAEQGVQWSKGSSSVELTPEEIESVQWVQQRDGYVLRVHMTAGGAVSFSGLGESEAERVRAFSRDALAKDVEEVKLATNGWNFGRFEFTKTSMQFLADDKQVFEVPLSSISQSVIQGRSEVAIEFEADDVANREDEVLTEMRVWVPANPEDGEEDGDDADGKDKETAVAEFNRQIIEAADIAVNRDKSIASFSELLFTVPRGRYNIDMFAKFLKLHGKTFSYKISYSNISKLFLLDSADGIHMILIIALKQPIRTGRTSHHFLLLQFKTDEATGVTLNMDEEVLQQKYAGKLALEMEGPLYDIFTRVLKALTSQKVVVPGQSFQSHQGLSCVRCSLRADEGYLYMLERSFFFIKKPPTWIRYADVKKIEFERVGGGNRRFDINVFVRGEAKPYWFRSIDKDELRPLSSFFRLKNITTIGDSVDYSTASASSSRSFDADPYMQQLQADAGGAGDEDSEEEEDFAPPSDDDEDSEEYSERSRADSDMDDEEYEKLKKRDEEEDQEGDAEDDDGDGDVASDAAAAGSGDDFVVDDIGASSASKKAKGSKRGKKRKLGGPKRNKSSWMFFCADVRTKMREEHPDASMGELTKLMSTKWKALTAEEKKPYEEQAKADKERFLKEKAELEEKDGNNDDGNKKQKTGKSKKKKKEKRQGEPKRPVSAYFMFLADRRPEAKKEHADKSMIEITKLLSAQWRQLSDAEKQVYVDRNAKAKEEYEVAKAKFDAEWAAKVKEAAAAKAKAKAAADDDNGDDDGAAPMDEGGDDDDEE